MIDWNKTKKEFGVLPSNYSFNSTVCVICDKCGKDGIKKIRSKKNVVDGQMEWMCMSCHVTKPNTRKKKSEASKKMWRDEKIRNKIVNSIDYDEVGKKNKELWNDPEYRNKITKHIHENKKVLSDKIKEKWKDPDYRNKMMDLYQTDEWRSQRSKIASDAWSDEDYRNKMSKLSSERWNDEDYRNKMSKAREHTYKVFNIQHILYSILDDLNIKYYREYNHKENDKETKIGPYSFDCVIPLKDKTLLIECQGDYWHSIKGSESKDKAKATYIEKYHPNCELKCVWEHEFSCKDKIIELIKYWCGITNIELIEFNFKDVQIKQCKAKEYKSLLEKYHYLANAGRGGMAHGTFGAYLENQLIAVCVFSPLVRQNMPRDNDSTRELSRLCIHPRYQKRNFASWFITRCIKQLPDKYKTIISYCDTTFNHDGAVYKACNFKLDGEVKSDYWYTNEDGWVMHKKTLYNKASKMKMKEKEFADANGYKKIYGKKKLRFVFSKE